MFLSRCCRAAVFAEHGGEGTSYYVCENCSIACDIVCSSTETDKDCVNAQI